MRSAKGASWTLRSSLISTPCPPFTFAMQLSFQIYRKTTATLPLSRVRTTTSATSA
jgi:hypothetical protein